MSFADFDQLLQKMLMNDTGFSSEPRVPNTNAVKVLDNGTKVLINFTLMYPVRGNFQPLMVLDYEIYNNPEIEIIKIANNRTADLGDTVSFTIVVNNTGDCNLTGIVVSEKIPDGLSYLSFEGKNWTKDSDKFIYGATLEINKTASFTIYFNVTKIGNLTNTVVVSSDVTENKSANNTTHVNSPNLSVEKISLSRTVNLGQLVEFEIVVRNTGETDLKNVWVIEDNFTSGLKYIKFTSKTGVWKYDENKNQFNLQDILKVGESRSFIIVFNTSSTGLKTNTVKAGYDNTTLSNSTNTTEVVNNTSENETSDDNDDTPEDVPLEDDPVFVNETSPDTHQELVHTNVKNYSTANPVLLALLALISMMSLNFKRKF